MRIQIKLLIRAELDSRLKTDADVAAGEVDIVVVTVALVRAMVERRAEVGEVGRRDVGRESRVEGDGREGVEVEGGVGRVRVGVQGQVEREVVRGVAALSMGRVVLVLVVGFRVFEVVEGRGEGGERGGDRGVEDVAPGCLAAAVFGRGLAEPPQDGEDAVRVGAALCAGVDLLRGS